LDVFKVIPFTIICRFDSQYFNAQFDAFTIFFTNIKNYIVDVDNVNDYNNYFFKDKKSARYSNIFSLGSKIELNYPLTLIYSSKRKYRIQNQNLYKTFLL